MVGTPNYPRSFGDAFSDLKTKIGETRTAANTRQAMSIVKAATLTFLGDLVIEAGGRLIARYTPDIPAFVVGKSRYDETRKGLWMYRPDGQVLMSVYRNADESGFFGMYDRNGYLMFSEDAASGWGIAEPQLSYTLPVATGTIVNSWPQTTATTMTTIATSSIRIYHPRLEVQVVTAGSGTFTCGIAFFVNGTQASTTQSATWNETFSVPGWGVAVKPGSLITVDLRAQILTGTGTIYAQVHAMNGIGSA